MRRILTALIVLAALPQLAGAQVAPLLELVGAAPGDAFGQAAGGIGDVTGDGVPEFIVGALSVDTAGTNAGAATVHSGADGSVVFTVYGLAPGDQFGYSADGAGDVDDDGCPDFMVGAEFADPGGTSSGGAWVYSGATGLLLRALPGDAPNDRQGVSLHAAGDVDGDGFDDVVIAANKMDQNGTDSGAVRVYSGATGAILWTFNGMAAGDEFGEEVAGGRDINGDGVPDVVGGAPFSDAGGTGSGMAMAFSGLDGTLLHSWNGFTPGDRFGSAVGLVDDLDGDGCAEVVVGAVLAAPNGIHSGSAYVFSGLGGGLLFQFDGPNPNALQGRPTRGAGDVNGDGFDDVLVGAPGDNGLASGGGAARIYSGLDGALLVEHLGGVGAEVGASGAPVGDLNGDGFADVVVGATEGGVGPGAVAVITGCRARRYGTGLGGDNVLDLAWTPGTGSTAHQGALQFSAAPPNALGILFAGPAEGLSTFGALTVLLDLSSIATLGSFTLPFDGSGAFAIPLDLGLAPLAGVPLYLQSVVAQPASILASNGLEIVFCP